MKTKTILFTAFVALATVIILFSSKKENNFSVYNIVSSDFDEHYIINSSSLLTEDDFIYFIPNTQRKNFKILNFYQSILNFEQYFPNQKCILSFKGGDFLFATKLETDKIDDLKNQLLKNPNIVKDLPFVKNNPIVFSNNGVFISNNKNLITATIKKGFQEDLKDDIKNIKKILSAEKIINFLTKDSLNNWKGYDLNKANDSTWQVNFISKNNKIKTNFTFKIPTYLKDNYSDSIKINHSYLQILTKYQSKLNGKIVNIETIDSSKLAKQNTSLSEFFNSDLILDECINFNFSFIDEKENVFLNKNEKTNYFKQQIALNKNTMLNNIVIQHKKQFSFDMNPPIINYNKQWIVINHITNNTEVLNFNNLTHTLSLINSNDTLWCKTIASNIIGDVVQIDAYKNNKLQYIFVNTDSLYIIDRNGKDIDNFPIKIKKPITGISVIDYENNKNYRLFNSYKNGIQNFDLNGKNTVGWIEQNSYLNSILPLQHFIINKKDYIVTINNKGKVNLLNRKGEVRYGSKTNIEKPEKIKSYKLSIQDELKSSSIHILYEDSTQLNLHF